jgi:hypothetical protein
MERSWVNHLEDNSSLVFDSFLEGERAEVWYMLVEMGGREARRRAGKVENSLVFTDFS